MRGKSNWRYLLLPVFIFVITSCSAVNSNGRSNAPSGPPAQQWQNEWTRGAVFYEVFVRSFQDSNGDGIGDLKGLISKLDYLNDGKPETNNDLGVDALWLMPVFQSPSYHGYDTINYREIESDYGTNEDFRMLCEEAHKRGMKIIVDYVMNHSGVDNPWFVESASSTNNPKRNWYVWSATNPGWGQPWGNNPSWHQKNGAFYYGVFWSGMPDLNHRSPAVRKVFRDNATFWLNRGVDGFRLDATRHLIETGPGPGQSDTAETHAALKEFAAHIRKVKPQAMIVGENWTDTPIIAKYFGSTDVITAGDELPMNFNFPLSTALLQGINMSAAQPIADKITEYLSLYPRGVNDAPFLTNHDQVRLATQFANSMPKMKNAAAVLLTLPGATFLYYGEEVGLRNGPTTGDESKRTPMPWSNEPGGGFTTAGSPWFQFAPGRDTANVKDQMADPASLLSRYRNLIKARKSSTALTKGNIEILNVTGMSSPVLAFVRRSAEDQVLVVHNLSDSFTTAGPYNVTAITMEKIFADTGVNNPSGTSGRWTVVLPARSSGIFRFR